MSVPGDLLRESPRFLLSQGEKVRMRALFRADHPLTLALRKRARIESWHGDRRKMLDDGCRCVLSSHDPRGGSRVDV
jgi:hypothetical protein